MQESSIRFNMFHEFSEIRRNNSRQSCQPEATFRRKLDSPAVEDKHHLIYLRLKSQQNQKVILLNFDNIIHQTIVIFQKSSGFLEWESLSSNSERYII